MARSFPTFGGQGRPGFQNGVVGVLGVRSECASRSCHSDSIAIVVVAASAVEEIIVSALLHEPLSFDDASLPSLVVLHQQLWASSRVHAGRIKQDSPELSGVTVCVSIYLVNNVIVHSFSENSRVDNSFRSVCDQRCALVGIRPEDVVSNGGSDR